MSLIALNPIDEIINGDRGLLSWLNTNIDQAAPWNNYQIKPYEFGSPKSAGFRITDFNYQVISQTPLTMDWSQSLIIGRMVPYEEDTTSQILVSQLAAEIVAAVASWAKCNSIHVDGIEPNGSGNLGRKPQQGISSTNPNAWWMVAEVRCRIKYKVIAR